MSVSVSERIAEAPDIVELASSIGLTPAEWLALTSPGVTPPTPEEYREAVLSTVVDDR